MAVPDPPQGAALVTSSARGIGRATVEALAAVGWHVFAGVRDPDLLEPLAASSVQILQMDVTDADSVCSACLPAEGTSGGALGCVDNNAGWPLLRAVGTDDP